MVWIRVQGMTNIGWWDCRNCKSWMARSDMPSAVCSSSSMNKRTLALLMTVTLALMRRSIKVGRPLCMLTTASVA